MMNHLGRAMRLRTVPRTLSQSRPLSTTTLLHYSTPSSSSTSSGGFGETERKEHHKSKPYDQPPYQNEYTRSGTHDEVSKSSDAFDGSNTDPSASLKKQGGALDGSGANEEWSKDYRPGKSNKNERDHTEPSQIKRAGGSGADNGGHGAQRQQDSAQGKFDKLQREGTDDKVYQGYSSDKRK